MLSSAYVNLAISRPCGHNNNRSKRSRSKDLLKMIPRFLLKERLDSRESQVNSVQISLGSFICDFGRLATKPFISQASSPFRCSLPCIYPKCWIFSSYYNCVASKTCFSEIMPEAPGVFEVSQADLQNDEDQAYRKIMPEPFVVSPLAPSILVPSLC
ncbi:hypothetical protein ZWY2020_008272 [Hordeum vulgare]|nr:hypothetical protein ZWY2020_008272 [Hordeum vulgare]